MATSQGRSGEAKRLSGHYFLFECPKRWRQDFSSHRTATGGTSNSVLLGMCVGLLSTSPAKRVAVGDWYRNDLVLEGCWHWVLPRPFQHLSCHPPAGLLLVWVKALLDLCAALLAEHTWEGVCSFCLGTHAELKTCKRASLWSCSEQQYPAEPQRLTELTGLMWLRGVSPQLIRRRWS